MGLSPRGYGWDVSADEAQAPLREQYSQLSWVEKQSLGALGLGLGFVGGGLVGWLLGDFFQGAAIGAVALFLPVFVLAFLPRSPRSR